MGGLKVVSSSFSGV